MKKFLLSTALAMGVITVKADYTDAFTVIHNGSPVVDNATIVCTDYEDFTEFDDGYSYGPKFIVENNLFGSQTVIGTLLWGSAPTKEEYLAHKDETVPGTYLPVYGTIQICDLDGSCYTAQRDENLGQGPTIIGMSQAGFWIHLNSAPADLVSEYVLSIESQTNPEAVFECKIVFAPSQEAADDFLATITEVNGLRYNLDSFTETARIVSKSPDYSGHIIIPSKVDHAGTTFSVTTIAPWAFKDCRDIQSVEIPNSMTSIGSSAFSGCTNLREVDIIDGDQSISFGQEVFHDAPITTLHLGRIFTCTSSAVADQPFQRINTLTTLTIGDSVNSIGERAFSSCSNLKSIEIGNSVSSIGDWAFVDCKSLESVKIPASTITIGESAFHNCQSLTSLEIGSSVSSIGISAFSSCQGLTSIRLPSSTTKINDQAFSFCDSLKEVIIANEDEPLIFGNKVFYGSPIETLYLGRNFVCISSDVDEAPFKSLSSLTMLSIGNQVTKIGAWMFYECNLNAIDSRAHQAPTIDYDTFSDYTKIYSTVTIPEGALESYQERWLMFKCFNSDVPEANTYTVTTPGNLINQLPLDRVEELTSLKLIGRINGTDILVLNKCCNLINLDLSEATIVGGGRAYYEENGTSFETEDNTLGEMWCHNLKMLTWLKLPGNLEKIGYRSFFGLTHLAEIKIPDSVISIGYQSFMDCPQLTSVTIGNSVTTIGDLAFSDCRNMISLVIGNAVTSIGDSAFSGCNSLKSLKMGSAVTLIGDSAFAHCSSLPSIEIGDSVTSIGNYAFSDCSGLSSVAIGNAVTSIGDYAFYDCLKINSLKIGSSVTAIGNSAFSGCTSLTEVNIPDPIHVIGDGAFYGCSSLENVIVPGSVRKIGLYAFSVCSSLKTVKIINPIPPVIESNTFSNSSSITLTVPEGSRNLYWIHPNWSKFSSIETWAPDESQRFETEGIIYQITSEADSTVEITELNLDHGIYDINIPETVLHQDRVYRVAGISNTGLGYVPSESLRLPSSIGYIGLEAFQNCPYLIQLECMSTVPPSVDVESFVDKIYQDCELEVPEESISAYKANPVWSKFTIKEPSVMVTMIDLNPIEWSGSAGDEFQITATVYPLNASTKDLNWSSSNYDIATVDESGLVTVIQEGYCTITASAVDGSGVTASCQITAVSGINDVIDKNIPISIFNLSGSCIYNKVNVETLNNLSSGIYIIRQRGGASKIMVR